VVIWKLYRDANPKILTSETLALQPSAAAFSPVRPISPRTLPLSDALATAVSRISKLPRSWRFLGSLSVKRVPNSRLLDITFESTSPLQAAQIVNAHIKNYIEQNFQSRYEPPLALPPGSPISSTN